ncbi:MAG: sulfatase [Verrucomicrobiales bacterium]|nr:sulfatase [Verrucomicrobiales bacterium]|tara:strand:+ start:546 stop:1952 length:1407 start_codon:yes stop_codon:yes gene_type:complete
MNQAGHIDRRSFLSQTANGFGSIALANLLADEALADAPARQRAPRAKNVIFLFMVGAPSHLDLYDPKPELSKRHRQRAPDHLLKGLNDPVVKASPTLFASPRIFEPQGQSGIEISDYLPHIGSIADEICLVRSMHTHTNVHDPAQLLFGCGNTLFGHPSMGSWITYGLGSESRDLPGYIVMTSDSGHGICAGSNVWSNGFLPSQYRGVTFRSQGEPVLNVVNPPGVDRSEQRARIEAIGALNRERFRTTGDPEIKSRIASYEMAFRMQAAVPELVKLDGESEATREAYGLNHELTRPFGTNCLLARRMVERGVRFAMLAHSNWDHHNNLNVNLKKDCDMVDTGCAALIRDLKQRGLLDETLIIWGGEFGRTPMNEVRRGFTPGREGRDHHPYAFSTWLCGGGIKSGTVVGNTDDFGYHAIEDRVHVHDLHATILHCLGIDHEQLTYRHQGRNHRLTDVHGDVIHKMLA